MVAHELEATHHGDWHRGTPKPPPREAAPPIITPNHVQTTRVLKYVFCSADRDITIYPDPSLYRVRLPKVLRNVIAVSLHTGVIPRAEYNVNKWAQWLDIDDGGGTIYEVKLPVGNYNQVGLAPEDFASALQAAIIATNAALAGYTVVHDTLTQKVTINSNGAPFSILWATGPNQPISLWQQMGFPRVDTALLTSHTSTGVLDMTGNVTIDLFIDELEGALEGAELAHINLTPVISYTNYTPLDSGSRVYFWPIGKLGYMTLRFMVARTVLVNGVVESAPRLYDFNGKENNVRFEFVVREYRNVLEDEVELDPAM